MIHFTHNSCKTAITHYIYNLSARLTLVACLASLLLAGWLYSWRLSFGASLHQLRRLDLAACPLAALPCLGAFSNRWVLICIAS